MMRFFLASVLLLGVSAFRLRVANQTNLIPRNGSTVSNATNVTLATKLQTFMQWYDGYSSGLGIWKWQQALMAYQRHFARYANYDVKLLEVGVQSGGSIAMYRAALGAKCHYYGMDINPKCTQFDNPFTTIAILDQGQEAHWNHYWANVVPNVDILIDDGGHQGFQMLTTLRQLPHIAPGGVHLIEDIHGTNENYMTSLFNPGADFLASQGDQVAAVHIYPFVMVVQKAGGSYVPPPPAVAAVTVATVDQLMQTLPHYRGQTVRLANPTWETMLSANGLKNFFNTFYTLHEGHVDPQPAGCFNDAVKFPQCTMYVTNTELQSLVSGVDIYPTYVHVHVAATPPTIYATRRGTIWIPYGF